MTRILVVDNYDSFVYNVVHYLAQIGAEVDIWRNDDPRFSAPDWDQAYHGVLISPGPGAPENAGYCVELVRSIAGRRPVFGICLGLQAIAVAYGATVGRADELFHGKTSLITHDGLGVFAGLAHPLRVTRYHSLAIIPETLPEEILISAQTETGVIMAIRHRSKDIEAVQFHPESVLTEGGYQMLANWLARCGDDEAVARAKNLKPLII